MMAEQQFNQTPGYPVSKRMSARYEGTFAHTTVKDRMPRILTQVIDTVHQEEESMRNKHGEAGTEDVKAVISQLSELRYQLQTNKEMKPISMGSDVSEWNAVFDTYRKDLKDEPKWFSVSWLFAECYMYRRIAEILANSSLMKNYDPFAHQKEASFIKSLPQITTVAGFVNGLLSKPKQPAPGLRVDFEHLLLLCLWGNKLDLSMMASVDSYDASQEHLLPSSVSSAQQAQLMRTNILADHSSNLWGLLELVSQPKSSPRRIDFVLDNAGLEIFSDLCLADWMVTVGFADRVQFHMKQLPWFVSDATVKDLHWTLDTLASQEDKTLSNLGTRWKERMADGTFVAVDHPFWTMSYEYKAMQAVALDLYKLLSEAYLVIFKGDLNYRKLLADRNWMYTENFTIALGGFEPTNLCALRTLKADLVTGLEPGVAERVAKQSKDWMITGQYAVLQVHKN